MTLTAVIFGVTPASERPSIKIHGPMLISIKIQYQIPDWNLRQNEPNFFKATVGKSSPLRWERISQAGKHGGLAQIVLPSFQVETWCSHKKYAQTSAPKAWGHCWEPKTLLKNSHWKKEIQQTRRGAKGFSSPYLFWGEQGRVKYWHIGSRRKAKAIVARTEKRRQGNISAFRPNFHSTQTSFSNLKKLLQQCPIIICCSIIKARAAPRFSAELLLLVGFQTSVKIKALKGMEWPIPKPYKTKMKSCSYSWSAQQGKQFLNILSQKTQLTANWLWGSCIILQYSTESAELTWVSYFLTHFSPISLWPLSSLLKQAELKINHSQWLDTS